MIDIYLLRFLSYYRNFYIDEGDDKCKKTALHMALENHWYLRAQILLDKGAGRYFEILNHCNIRECI